MSPVRLASFFAILVSAEAFSLGETHIPNNIAVSLRQWDETARDRDTGYPTYGARGGGYDFNYPDFVKTYETLMRAGIQYFDCPTMMAEETFAEMLRSANKSLEMPMYAVQDRFEAKQYYGPIPLAKEELDIGFVDVYQMHKVTPETARRAREQLDDGDIAIGVGVVGMNGKQLREAHKLLDKEGIELISNQFTLNLGDQGALYDGTLKACQELGITPIARSPLAYGYVCGKYTWADPHGNGAEGRGVRAANVKRYDRRKLQALRILHEELENIAKKASTRLKAKKKTKGEITPTMVALKWVEAKGAVPQVAIRSPYEAREVVATKGWQLTKKEIKALDRASRQRGYCKAATNWFWGRHPLLRNLRQWLSDQVGGPGAFRGMLLPY